MPVGHDDDCDGGWGSRNVGVRTSQQSQSKSVSRENAWSDLPFLRRRNDYVNPDVKIRMLQYYETNEFEVTITPILGCLFNNANKRLNIRNGIFVVNPDGRMFITPDRMDPSRKYYMDGSVLCHPSFAPADVCRFAGLITLVDGFPTNISNESGSFFPNVLHLVRTRSILATLCGMSENIITLDIVGEVDDADISSLLQHGYNHVVDALLKPMIIPEYLEPPAPAPSAPLLTFTPLEWKTHEYTAEVTSCASFFMSHRKNNYAFVLQAGQWKLIRNLAKDANVSKEAFTAQKNALYQAPYNLPIDNDIHLFAKYNTLYNWIMRDGTKEHQQLLLDRYPFPFTHETFDGANQGDIRRMVSELSLISCAIQEYKFKK